jgi:nucleotide-binding universal stress UspA family protein
MQHSSSLTLLCYDGSNSSKHAVAVASQTLAPGEVVILHIWARPPAALADSYSESRSPAAHSFDELEARESARATAIAQEGLELARSLGLSATISVQRADGDEWRVILDAADAVDAGLIVLGTRGHTGVQDRLLGTSVSGDVLHHSLRPVLVVPTPDEVGPHSVSEAASAAARPARSPLP